MKLAHVMILSSALAGCGGDDSSHRDAASTPDASAGDAAVATDASVALASNVVYVESNALDANAIFAFQRGSDGSLTPLAGSPFSTGGTGIANPAQALGPDDSDQELALSSDHHRLYAVNGGSDTIAVMDIQADGSLKAVSGSPFSSGGSHPVSIGVSGDTLFVVNQGGSADADAGTVATAGTYTTLHVDAAGTLTKVSDTPAGASPSVALVSNDGALVFGADFLSFTSTPPTNPLRSFVVASDGSLTNAPGTPLAIPTVAGGTPPGTPAALGLAVHPSQKVLYVGFVLRNQIGVYTYASDGSLTYVTNAPVSGPAPCWIRASADGTRLYVTDTANDSVSVLDSTNALAPTEIQNVQLADTGPSTTSATGMVSTASETYQESLSPDGKFLYVVSQRTTTDESVTAGDVLHVLAIGSDGKVTETSDVALPDAVTARAQGVIVL